MFILQNQPIDTIGSKNSYHFPSNGAFVTFEGLVRNDKVQGKEVASLFYMADENSCISEGQLIINQAQSMFKLNSALCIQRIGQVEIGQSAIWIGTWSSHRDEAFKGCRYIIEETKKRLLIWKKEFYTDGTCAWIHGPQTPVIK